MLTAGLTGGLACGKSFVGRELARLGCHIISADELGHEVLEPAGEAYHAAVKLLGPAVLNEQRFIDRARVAELVFHDAHLLGALNAIVHPAVRARQRQLLAGTAAHAPHAIAIVEAAILIETGAYREFDKLIVVICDEERQIERALHRDPYATREGVLARIARQIPVEKKREFADFLIDSSGTEQETLRQTQEVFHELKRLEEAAPHPAVLP